MRAKSTPRIAIDFSQLDSIEPTSGQYRYAIDLISGLAGLNAEAEFLLLGSRSEPVPELSQLLREHESWSYRPLPRQRFRGSAYLDHARYGLLLRREGVSLLHSLHTFIPLTASCPVITTVYDLMFELFDEYEQARRSRPYRMHRWAVKNRARRVISISETTAGDLRSRWRVSDDKIDVVPLGSGLQSLANFDEAPATSNSLLPQLRAGRPRSQLLPQLRAGRPRSQLLPQLRAGRPRSQLLPQLRAGHPRSQLLPQLRAGHPRSQRSSPVLMSPYNLEPRKNLDALLQAMSLLISEHPNLKLQLFGRAAVNSEREVAFESRLRELNIEKYVDRTGILTDHQLAELYSQATLFVFPSLYEGFGLPLLEAMSMGACVVARNASAMAEVVGDAGHLVDSLEPPSLAGAITGLLENSNLRRQLGQAAQIRARQFNVERMAKLTYQSYLTALNGKHEPQREFATDHLA